MYKTSVYTFVNGDTQWLRFRKQQKIIKRRRHSPSDCLMVNVLLNNITFLWHLLFSKCQSLRVAMVCMSTYGHPSNYYLDPVLINFVDVTNNSLAKSSNLWEPQKKSNTMKITKKRLQEKLEKSCKKLMYNKNLRKTSKDLWKILEKFPQFMYVRTAGPYRRLVPRILCGRVRRTEIDKRPS